MIDYASILKAEEYDFLRKEEQFGTRVILLGLSGSYSFAAKHNELPESPDMDAVQEYVMSVNEKVVWEGKIED